MKKLACFILSYDITKGMKSIGPKGLLKSKKSKELINCQISSIKDKNIDINIILGFGSEKIKKKVDHSVNFIDNLLYESTNQAYALELIMDNYDCEIYDGCIIINNGILFHCDIKNILLQDKNISKIFYMQNSKKNEFAVGVTIHDDNASHMFFNLDHNSWCEIIYINNETMNYYKNTYIKEMRNMFLFELFNKSIDDGNTFKAVKVNKNKLIKISSIKDSEKIKNIL
jgi:choline kinase